MIPQQKITGRVLSRTVEPTEVPPILARTETQTIVLIPGTFSVAEAANYRYYVYHYNRQHHSRAYFKTHLRPQGLYIERWR